MLTCKFTHAPKISNVTNNKYIVAILNNNKEFSGRNIFFLFFKLICVHLFGSLRVSFSCALVSPKLAGFFSVFIAQLRIWVLNNYRWLLDSELFLSDSAFVLIPSVISMFTFTARFRNLFVWFGPFVKSTNVIILKLSQ